MNLFKAIAKELKHPERNCSLAVLKIILFFNSLFTSPTYLIIHFSVEQKNQ